MYASGGTAATRGFGWGMVVSGAAAVGCAAAGASAYPPLVPEVVLAGVSALCAAGWVAASYRARGKGPLDAPPRKARPDDRVLPYLFAFGIPVATMAAFLVVFTPSGARGQWEERMEAAGYGEHRVPVVRLAGEPEYVPEGEDHDAYYLSDVVVRVPFRDGSREVTVKGYSTAPEPPAPGTELEVYYAPGAPDGPVGEHDEVGGAGSVLTWAMAIWVWPWVIIAGCVMKSYVEPSDVRRIRRFRPVVHLPALGILLAGAVLLLPKALGFHVAGFDRLPAFVAAFTPALALTWVAKASWSTHRF
ncbi:hypothetical protein ABZ618_22690 [Streptomyces roseolus]|uniref:hypothetical protein n=1 Tax=Streptomyces roseolus TaxID=67358 RepID=UPI0033CC0FE2